MEIRRNRENNLGGTFTCLGKHVVGSCMVMVGEDDFNSFPDVADSTDLIGRSPFINVFTTFCVNLTPFTLTTQSVSCLPLFSINELICTVYHCLTPVPDDLMK